MDGVEREICEIETAGFNSIIFGHLGAGVQV